MTGVLGVLPAGTKGFDTNQVVSASSARAFYNHGYRFVRRYLPRLRLGASDLTGAEVERLLDAGLAVAPVQHVESAESWTPTLDKGSLYGTVAANMARAAGIVAGTCVALDLEGVAVGTPAQTVIDYCREWFHCVESAGFLPDLYVGWHCGLTAEQLYHDLPFERYWSAYNLNGNEYPHVRGVCMEQEEARYLDRPTGETLAFDTNYAQADRLGGLPLATCPQ